MLEFIDLVLFDPTIHQTALIVMISATINMPVFFIPPALSLKSYSKRRHADLKGNMCNI